MQREAMRNERVVVPSKKPTRPTASCNGSMAETSKGARHGMRSTRGGETEAPMNTARIVVWMLAIVAVPLPAALARVWIRQQNVSLGYRLHQAEQHSEALRMELQKLEVARAGGRTPQRVAAMAKRLGLEPAQASQVLPLRIRVVQIPDVAGR